MWQKKCTDFMRNISDEQFEPTFHEIGVSARKKWEKKKRAANSKPIPKPINMNIIFKIKHN